MLQIKEKLQELQKSKHRSKLILVLVMVILALLLYRFKSVFIAATVNSAPISRLAVVQELEKQGGKSILDNLITNALILQEAKKEKVVITQPEIDAEIAKVTANLKTQGQDLDQILTTQGMTKADLNDQIRLQLLVQKMAGQGIEVTDKEVQDNFTAGQKDGTYAKNVKFADVQAQIKSQLNQQKLNDKITAWIQDLRSKAKINHFVNY